MKSENVKQVSPATFTAPSIDERRQKVANFDVQFAAENRAAIESALNEGMQVRATRPNLDGSTALQAHERVHTARTGSPFDEAHRNRLRDKLSSLSMNDGTFKEATFEKVKERIGQTKGAEFLARNAGNFELLATTSNHATVLRSASHTVEPPVVRGPARAPGACNGRCHVFLANFDPSLEDAGRTVDAAVAASTDDKQLFQGALTQGLLLRSGSIATRNTRNSGGPLTLARLAEDQAKELDKAFPDINHRVTVEFPPRNSDAPRQRQYADKINRLMDDAVQTYSKMIVTGRANFGQHSVAYARVGEDRYILDPNIGIFKADTEEVAQGLIETFLPKLSEGRIILTAMDANDIPPRLR